VRTSHLNLNVIATLNYFTMLCEYWLGIPTDTSLFWYFYGPTWYDKHAFFGIGLTLRHHQWKQYLDATFKGCWKGATRKWLLIDMHTDPQWTNKYILLPLIDDKPREPEITPRLQVLVDRETELYQTGLQVCHCAEEWAESPSRPSGEAGI
jgi:hypothetical protein